MGHGSHTDPTWIIMIRIYPDSGFTVCFFRAFCMFSRKWKRFNYVQLQFGNWPAKCFTWTHCSAETDGVWFHVQKGHAVQQPHSPLPLFSFFAGAESDVVADHVRRWSMQLHYFQDFQRWLPCCSLLTCRHDCIVVIQIWTRKQPCFRHPLKKSRTGLLPLFLSGICHEYLCDFLWLQFRQAPWHPPPANKALHLGNGWDGGEIRTHPGTDMTKIMTNIPNPEKSSYSNAPICRFFAPWHFLNSSLKKRVLWKAQWAAWDLGSQHKKTKYWCNLHRPSSPTIARRECCSSAWNCRTHPSRSQYPAGNAADLGTPKTHRKEWSTAKIGLFIKALPHLKSRNLEHHIYSQARMYVCMYVCMYIYIYICLYIYIYMYVYIYIYIYICMYIYIYIYTYTHIHIHIHIHIRIRIRILIRIRIRMYTYRYIYIYIYVCTYMYTYIYIYIYIYTNTYMMCYHIISYHTILRWICCIDYESSRTMVPCATLLPRASKAWLRHWWNVKIKIGLYHSYI